MRAGVFAMDAFFPGGHNLKPSVCHRKDSRGILLIQMQRMTVLQ